MKLLLLLPVFLLSAFATHAAEVLACPAWEIVIVDDTGKGVAGCNVAQEWGCTFKAGYVGATTNAVTDATGKVEFPARLVSSPPPESSRWKKIRRYRTEWIRKGDPGVVATKSGLRLRLMLRPEKP
jgi:hypothetical protein